MTHQKFFIDQRKQPHHFIDARLRNLDVKGASQVQRFKVLHPGERDVVVGPVTRYRNCNFIVASPLERPVV